MFDRRIGDSTLTFGVSGMLRQSNLVMWDQETESWWQQGIMKAMVGELAGKALPVVASQVISWADFRETYPKGTVLSRLNRYALYYGISPYESYDTSAPSLFEGRPDTRLPVMERVVGLSLGGTPIAYPFGALAREPVLSQRREGLEIVIFYDEETLSVLDQRVIKESRAIGSVGVFLPVVEGRHLTFRKEGRSFVDQETGSTWNILGKAVAGPMKGKALPPVFHTQPFWFYWAAVHPETEVYKAELFQER